MKNNYTYLDDACSLIDDIANRLSNTKITTTGIAGGFIMLKHQ